MIREEAAKRLARQLLERRLSRVTPLSEKFVGVMARMIMTYVAMDEQQQNIQKNKRGSS